MKKIITLIPFLLLAGCESHYRYPCQDPANWEKKECNDEICKADGSCTSDVLGANYKSKENPVEENLTVPENEISNDDTSTISKPDCAEKVNKKEHKKSAHMSQEDLERNVTETEVEEPTLTMDSVVDTKEHNSAAK